MAAPRAVWKGHLKFGALTCAVKLIGAVSDSEKITFNTLNRTTRNPVRAAYVDQGTGKVVETEDQVKGYELDQGRYLLIDQEEIKALKPENEHSVEVEDFVGLEQVDTRYLEKPYFMIPADKVAEEPYAAIRDALKQKKAAARASIVFYQRDRDVLIQADGKGLVMTTLRAASEMVDAKSLFDGLGKSKIDKEMAEIAGLIIERKPGTFDPADFTDRYEDALAELIQAKKDGKAAPKAAPKPKKTNVVKLADVLRKSLEKEGGKVPSKKQASEPARKRA